MLGSRISKIQVPDIKVMAKVPDQVLQQMFIEQKPYLPVTISKNDTPSMHNSPTRSPQANDLLVGTPRLAKLGAKPMTEAGGKG